MLLFGMGKAGGADQKGFPGHRMHRSGIDVDFLAEVEAFGGAGLSSVCSYRYQAFTLLLRGAA